jgi:hypothetical protein
MLAKIISGGQTGVDRAALDVAQDFGILAGGWCPRGRRAEDGTIPPEYPLVETESESYLVRTEWNVRDSDGTLVLARGHVQGGTAATVQWAKQVAKPCLVLDPTEPQGEAAFQEWIVANGVRVLNIAGPRESEDPGLYAQATGFLRRALAPGGIRFQPSTGDTAETL